MARLHTTVESLSVIDGVRQPRTLNVRVVEPLSATSQAVAKGNLYVLLELGGETQPTPALFRLLLNTVQGVYYDAAGGITGGITEAILAAHQELAQHNAVHPNEAQLGGISCAVLRGEELYLGIGGPAVVLVHTANRVDQFPAELGENVIPLGNHEAPAIELFRTSIDSTGTVVQLSSEWLARVAAPKLATAALAPDIASGAEYLEALAPSRAVLSALLTYIAPATPEQLAAAAAAAAAAAGPPPDVAAKAARTAPDAPDAGDTPDTDADEGDDETAVAADAEETPDNDEQPAATPAVATVPAAVATAAEEDASVDEQPARRRRWPWLLALLIPLLIVAAVAIALWVDQQRTQAEFQTQFQGAQAAYAAASADGVLEDTARSQLADAKDRINAALALAPNDEAAASLLTDIQTRLDEVNHIVPLYKLVTLQPLGGEGSQPTNLVVEGPRVSILDQGQDRVTRYGLDEISGLIPEASGGVLAERGQILPDGQIVGELLDMTWADTGGDRRTSNLLILDSNRNLIQVDNATGLQPLAVGGRDQWQNPTIIASYNGNFYLVDAGQGRILRYRPTADGYSNPPENYLEGDATLDLSGAIDMAIDGNIWLLYQDGTVQTFLEGRQVPFVLQPPPDSPISQPQAIYAGSDAGTSESLFITDAGGARILEYDKEGTYLRQYRPVDRADLEKLRKMVDVQVDEIDGTFYILTSDALYSTDIPQPS
ncbi:MAG: hypothetical protein R2844_10235 [Caldilineales bacterium]